MSLKLVQKLAELPDLFVEIQIHTSYSAEVPSFFLPHFSLCTQSDGSINKKQSKELCGGERVYVPNFGSIGQKIRELEF